jgi:hypothetical protein
VGRLLIYHRIFYAALRLAEFAIPGISALRQDDEGILFVWVVIHEIVEAGVKGSMKLQEK